MSNTCSDPRGGRRRAAAAMGAILGLVACAQVPLPLHPRPAIPLPDDLAAHYALPGPVEEQLLAPVGDEGGVALFRGALVCGDERAEFHLLLPGPDVAPAREPGAARPFVLCLPILAGGRDLMAIVAYSLARRGHAVAWTERVQSALKPPQRGAELEELMRRTVVHNRMVLAWARRLPAVDPARMGCVGISMGGIVGGVVLALEPDLAGGALCLAGGDLPNMLEASTEARAESWRRWRSETDGVRGDVLREELQRALWSDPARLGPYVETEKVLMIGGSLDTVVAPRYQDRLWESLGRPARRTLPVGHYTSAVAFGAIVDGVDEFLSRRFAMAGRVAASAAAE